MAKSRNVLLNEKKIRKKEPNEERMKKIEENTVNREIVSNRYLETIEKLLDIPQYAKIQNNQYGGLSIDVPKLINEMKPNSYRGGKLIYESQVDKSLIDLLAKRFDPKKYSLNAVRIFNDLNTLTNLPKHRSSGKSKFVELAVVYYQNPKELANHMKILIRSMAAGNNSPILKNDLSQRNDEFLKIRANDKVLHEKFYNKYLK